MKMLDSFFNALLALMVSIVLFSMGAMKTIELALSISNGSVQYPNFGCSITLIAFWFLLSFGNLTGFVVYNAFAMHREKLNNKSE